MKSEIWKSSFGSLTHNAESEIKVKERDIIVEKDGFTEEIKPIQFVSSTQWNEMFSNLKEGSLPNITGYFIKSFIRKGGKYSPCPYFIVKTKEGVALLKGTAKLKPLLNNTRAGAYIKIECLGTVRNTQGGVNPLQFSVKRDPNINMSLEEIELEVESLRSILDDLEERPESASSELKTEAYKAGPPVYQDVPY